MMFRRLGLALRVSRELAGLSVRALAREAGVGPAQLSKYENGRELPKLATLEKVLGRLGLSPLSFFYLLHVLENVEDERAVTSSVVLSAPGHLSASEWAKFQGLFEQILGLYRAAISERARSRGSATGETFITSPGL